MVEYLPREYPHLDLAISKAVGYDMLLKRLYTPSPCSFITIVERTQVLGLWVPLAFERRSATPLSRSNHTC